MSTPPPSRGPVALQSPYLINSTAVYGQIAQRAMQQATNASLDLGVSTTGEISTTRVGRTASLRERVNTVNSQDILPNMVNVHTGLDVINEESEAVGNEGNEICGEAVGNEICIEAVHTPQTREVSSLVNLTTVPAQERCCCIM